MSSNGEVAAAAATVAPLEHNKHGRLIMNARLIIPFIVIISITHLFGDDTTSSITISQSTKDSNSGHICPSTMKLNCTDWLMDAFDTVKVQQGSIISKQHGAINSTQTKLCIIPSKNSGVLVNDDADPYNQKRKSAGFQLPKGIALIKCHGALIGFRLKSRQFEGVVSCGHSMPNTTEDYRTLLQHIGWDSSNANNAKNDITVKNSTVLLATDLRWPNLFQHNVQDGFGHVATAWNYMNDDETTTKNNDDDPSSNGIHILTGSTFKSLYDSIVGPERVYVTSGLKPFWFQTVIVSSVPVQFTPNHHEQQQQQQYSKNVLDMIKQVEYGTKFGRGHDPILPCSVCKFVGGLYIVCCLLYLSLFRATTYTLILPISFIIN